MILIKRVLILLILPFCSFSQEIIKDLNKSNASSYPVHFVNAGNKSFFFAKRGSSEMDLMVTDGTGAGTIPLSGFGISASNNPGFLKVSEQVTPDLMIRLGNKVIFKAYGNNPFIGEELWISDGTNAGTHVLKDIKPGPSSSGIEMFVSFNDKVLFLANGGSSFVKSLWITDGTNAGTRQVKEISPYTHKFINSSEWKVVNDKLFFIAETPFEGTELWVTDGTYSGTNIVKDIAPGHTSSMPSNLVVVNNKLFFQARVNGNTNSLFVTDGTSSGTTELLNMGNNVLDGAAYNNKLYFRHSTATFGSEVWTSDGTLSGTKLFNDINPSGSSSPSGFFSSNNVLFFAASKEGSNQKVLWKSNGVSLETVQDAASPFLAYNPIRWGQYAYALDMGDYFVFEANHTNSDSTELWRSNGTSAGTYRVKSFPKSSGFLGIKQEMRVGNYFSFFEIDDLEERKVIWVSDGTFSGTRKLENLASSRPFFNSVALGRSDNSLFFSAFDELAGFELYKTDGMSASLLKDLNTQIHNDPNNMFFRDTLNNQLYFTYNNNKNGLELWKTDGSSENTSLFYEFTKGTSTDFDFQNWLWSNSTKFGGVVNFKGKLYISANNKLYVSNGISAPELILGTQASITGTLVITKVGEKLFVADKHHKVWVIDSSHSITELLSTNGNATVLNSVNVSLDNIYIFAASTREQGLELWRSDGTAAGTFILKDISQGIQNTSFSVSYAACGGRLFFGARDSGGLESLWITDGTVGGTGKLKDFSGSEGWSSISSFTCVNNQEIIFSAYNNSAASVRLWKSDGLPSGTNPIASMPNGTVSSSSKATSTRNYPFAKLGNTIFFNLNLGGNNHLYKYDGTAFMIMKAYFEMSDAIVHDDKLYFAGNEYFNDKGEELWVSDGSFGETKLLKDINPGKPSSSPMNFYSLGENLFFMASDLNSGQEPWILREGCPEHLVLSDTINGTKVYKASKSITGEANNLIGSSAKINYQAGDFILISPGFETLPGSVFQTELKGCEQE